MPSVVDPRLVRTLTVLVLALNVVTAATGATVVMKVVRGDEPPTVAVEARSSDTTAAPTPSTGIAGKSEAVAPSTTTATSIVPVSSPTSAGAVPQCASLRSLPTRAKLAQLLIVGVSDLGTAKAALGGPNPAGGVLVLGRRSTWFANGVLKGLAGNAAVPPVVAADEEGGRVQRIDGIFGSMVSANQLGRLPATKVREIARDRGVKMKNLGFTMDFAPVVDLYDRNNAVINDRAFDADPQKVIVSGQAFASGLRDAGIAPVLKHFPGHGRSTGDSHKQAVGTPSLDELRKSDLKPFAALAGQVPAVMVGHLDVPGLTEPGRPTSVSKAAINGLLRTEMGFNGLVVTDDLSGMKAITDRFTVPAAVVASISAGADLAIVALAAGQSLAPMLNELEAAVKAGKVSMARIDDALDHLGRVKPGCR